MKKLIKFVGRYLPRPLLIKISYVVSPILTWFYAGNKHKCPICNKQFKKFMPHGNKGLDNRLCPSCLSLERHRLLWLFLNEKTDFFTAPAKVLHIAPEQPFVKRFAKLKNLDYITADLVSPIAQVKTDIRNMVFADNEFDWVICNHVMEHIDMEQKALKEILRVLKPGGRAILQVPIDYNLKTTYEDDSITSPKEREKHFGQYDHVRQYGLDYEQRLQKSGLVTQTSDFINSIDPKQQEFYRLDKNELIYLCKKN